MICKYIAVLNGEEFEIETIGEEPGTIDQYALAEMWEKIDDELKEAIENAICEYELPVQGRFEDSLEIQREQYKAVLEKLPEISRKFDVRINVHCDVKAETIVPDVLEHLKYLLDDREYTIDGLEAITCAIDEFVEEGVWHFALCDAEGNIEEDPEEWPEPIHDSAKIRWEKEGIPMKPIMWFGLEDELPDDGWPVDMTSDRWKEFWFEGKWENCLDKADATDIFWIENCEMEGPDTELLLDESFVDIDAEETPEEMENRLSRFMAEIQQDL